MARIFVFLADGFEEVEAITPIDYLRRAGLEVVTVGIQDKKVTSAHNITIICDCIITEVQNETPDMVIFPGGLPNAKTASKSTIAKAITLRVKDSGIIAGICAAPAMSFYNWGILDGKKYTCFPGMDAELPQRAETDRVVIDGKLITACGPGVAEEFAFALVEALTDSKITNKLKTEIVARDWR